TKDTAIKSNRAAIAPIPKPVLELRLASARKKEEEQLIDEVSLPPREHNKINTLPNMERGEKRKFVIVIPSYNNEKWCVKNIQSALDQNYDQYRIIFTDDASTDETFDKVYAIVEASNKKHLCSLFQNKKRVGALENLFNMIYSCNDDE